jgi:hypothetical protein
MYPFGDVSHLRRSSCATNCVVPVPSSAQRSRVAQRPCPRAQMELGARSTSDKRRVTLAAVRVRNVRNEPIRAPNTVCHTASKHQRLSPLTHAYLPSTKNLFRKFACMDGRLNSKKIWKCPKLHSALIIENVFDNAPRASAATHSRPRRGHAAATIHSRGPSAGPVRVVHQQPQHQRRAAREH